MYNGAYPGLTVLYSKSCSIPCLYWLNFIETHVLYFGAYKTDSNSVQDCLSRPNSITAYVLRCIYWPKLILMYYSVYPGKTHKNSCTLVPRQTKLIITHVLQFLSRPSWIATHALQCLFRQNWITIHKLSWPTQVETHVLRLSGLNWKAIYVLMFLSRSNWIATHSMGRIIACQWCLFRRNHITLGVLGCLSRPIRIAIHVLWMSIQVHCG
jgi:hypothetical protein